MANTILVSACLLGLQTRYDGTSKADPKVLDFLREKDLLPIPVCPEQLGGLPTPRPPAFFRKGDGHSVLASKGAVANAGEENLNRFFIKGARETLAIACLVGCRKALLKERSPSCGVHEVYRAGVVTAGQGVTAALLQQEGLHLFSEEDL